MTTTTAKPTPETIELEAHAIYKNIGLTPRQLADQRAELIAALGILASYPIEEFCLEGKPNDYVLFGANDWLLNICHVRKARAALARTKAVPK